MGGQPYKKKNLALALVIAFACGSVSDVALANPGGPTGGVVTGGQATINTPNQNTTLIQQQSQNAVIDWQTFNVQASHTVQFAQPNANATALNRIHDQNPSQIFGAIIANGNVFLINPNGIVFGETATVNVNSLMATTLNVSAEDFMAGRWDFEQLAGVSEGMIVNRGLIAAANSGSVTLVAGAVVNTGVIMADYGQVTLAGATRTYVDFDGDGMLRFEVSGSVQNNPNGVDAAVANHGTIQANGGRVLLTAQAVDAIFAAAVNNTGIIQANRIENVGGVIRLGGGSGDVINTGTIVAQGMDGDGGTVEITGATVSHFGTIDVSSQAGQGGTIHLLGDKVGLFDEAVLDASGALGGGTILVGGDFQGGNAAIQNSSITYVAPEVTINASATVNGDGGTVIVWADDTTRFYGTITATGGEFGGNGGFAEVSGKRYLAYTGLSDLSAPLGTAGTLMLDPTNLEIRAGGGNQNIAGDTGNPGSPGPDPFRPAAADQVAILTWETIVANLANNAVLVTTVGSPDSAGQDGTITVVHGYTYSRANNLLIQAAGSIIVNSGAAIQNTGTGGLSLTAAGTIEVAAAITLAGGTLAVNGSGPASFTSVQLGAGQLNLSGVSGGSVTVAGPFSAGSLITGTGAYDLIFQGGGTVTGASPTVFQQTGNLSLGAAFAFLSGVSSSGPPNLHITENLTISANAGSSIDFSASTLILSHGVTLTLGGDGAAAVSVTLGQVQGSATPGAAARLVITTAGNVSLGGVIGLNIASVEVTGRTILLGASGAITTNAPGAPGQTSVSFSAGRSIVIEGAISTQGGDISMTAHQGADIIEVFTGLEIRGATLNAGGGHISLAGTGGGLGRGNSIIIGVQIHNAATVTTSGTGTVSISGTGGAGTRFNIGVQISGTGTQVSAAAGHILITGTGVGGTNSNYGVHVLAGAVVATTGVGGITLDGIGGAGTRDNIGVLVEGAGTQLRTVDGNLVLTGVGGDGSGFRNYGVNIGAGAVVTSTGTGDIIIAGVGGTGTRDNIGILVTGVGTEVAATDGHILMTGSGGSGSSSIAGIHILAGAVVSTSGTGAGAGGITLVGQGGIGTRDNIGLWIGGAGTRVTTVDGDIELTGTGGESTGSGNYGVYVQGGAAVSTTGTGAQAGNITVTGFGAVGTRDNAGILVMGAGTLISTQDGGIALQGTGGPGSTGNYGVHLQGVVVSATGGQILIVGDGSASGEYGVWLDASQVGGISQTGGISITSLGGSLLVGNVASDPGNVAIRTAGDEVTLVVANGDLLLGGALHTGSGLGVLVTLEATLGNIVDVSSPEDQANVITLGQIHFIAAGDVGSASNYLEVQGSGTFFTAVGGTAYITTDTADTEVVISSDTGTINVTFLRATLVIIGNEAGGAIVQTGGEVSGTFSVITLNGVDLILQANAINHTVGLLTLNSSGSITGEAGTEPHLTSFSAVSLLAAGDITLRLALGSVSQVVASAGGNVSLTAAGALVIGSEGVSSAGGDITLVAGLNLVVGGDLTSAGGNISLQNLAIASGGYIGVDLTGVTVDAGGGNIVISGIGGDTGGAAFGIQLADGAVLMTQGVGTMTLSGTGDRGIHLAAGAVLASTGTGTITLTGAGLGGGQGIVTESGTTVGGVAMDGNIVIESMAGDLSIAGLLRTAGTVSLTGTDAILLGSGGIITAGGAVSLTAGHHLVIAGPISTGGGDISLQNLANQSGTYVGIDLVGVILDAGGGSIALVGTGGDTGSSNIGIRLAGGAQLLTTGTGTVSLQGTGGLGTDAGYGIHLVGGGTRIATTGGDISLSGTGIIGIYIESGAVDAGAGLLSLIGTGTFSGPGIQLAADGVLGGGAGSGPISMTTTAGALLLTGTVQTDGDVTLSSAAAISGTGPIHADLLTASAATGVTLSHSGNTVNAFSGSSSGAGTALVFSNSGAFEVVQVTANGGDITLTAMTGDLSLSEGAISTGAAGNVTVTLRAMAGNIVDSGLPVDAVNITSFGRLIFVAAGDVGTALNPIEVSGTAEFNLTGVSGNAYLDTDTTASPVVTISNDTATIVVNSGGATLTIDGNNSGGAIVRTGGTVSQSLTIISENGIHLLIEAAGITHTGGRLVLNSSGDISGSGAGAHLISSSLLSLIAAGDITLTLTLNVGGAVEASAGGAITLHSVGGIGLVVSGAGIAGQGVTLVANSPLLVTSDVDGGTGPVLLVADGDQAGDTLTIAAPVFTQNNTITLVAGDSIVLQSGALYTSGSGDISLLAATNYNGGAFDPGFAGGIISNPGAVDIEVAGASDTILLFADGDIGSATDPVRTVAPAGARIDAESAAGDVHLLHVGSGAFNIAAAGSVTLAASGLVTVQVGDMVLAVAGAVRITAADLILVGTLQAGGAAGVTIVALPNTDISLGVGAGGLEISAAELANITTSLLTLETSGTGDINIVAADASGVGYALVLHTLGTGDINQTGTFQYGGSISLLSDFGAVTISDAILRALGGIEVDAANGVLATGTVEFVTADGDITLTSSLVISGVGASVIFDTTDSEATTGAGSTITLGDVSGGGDLILFSGQGQVLVNGDVTGIGTLTLHRAGTDATGTISFLGAVQVTTLVTAVGEYDLAFNDGASVDELTVFNNTGSLTLTGAFSFVDGLQAVAPSTVSIDGSISTTDTPLSLGETLLAGPVTLSTGTGEIVVGSVVVNDGGQNLAINTAGDAAFASIKLGTGVFDLTAVTAGSITVAGPFNASGLSTGVGAYDLLFQGGGAVTGETTTLFTHTGNLSIGASFAFASGVALSGPPNLFILGDTTLSTDAGFGIDLSTTITTLLAGVTLTLGGDPSIATDITLGALFGDAGEPAHLVVDTAGDVTLDGPVSLASVFIGAPSLNIGLNVAVVTSAYDGDIVFNVDTLVLAGGNSINAGIGSFQIFPRTSTFSIEFAPTNSGLRDVYYDSAFNNVMAGSFVIGAPTHTGDIHVGNATAALAVSYDLQIINGGGGAIIFENDYVVGGDFDLGLTAGAGGVVFADLDDGNLIISLGAGALSVDAPVTVANDTTITAGDAAFTSAITGAAGLAVSVTGSVSFEGTIDLDSLLITGNAILSGGSVDTLSLQVYNGAIEFTMATTLTAGGDISFSGTVDSPFALIIVDANGVSFDGVVLVDALDITANVVLFNASVTATGVTGGISVVATTRVTVNAPLVTTDGNIMLLGGGLDPGNYVGVLILAAVTTTGGDIIIVGQGGDTGSNNRGIRIAGTTVQSATGDITLTGVGGSGVGNGNSGVSLSAGVVTTGTGSITITGQASTAAADGTASHHGVRLLNGSLVAITSAGNLTITGLGGAAALPFDRIFASHGILIVDSSVLVANGDLALVGTALAESTPPDFNYGIAVFDANIYTENGHLSITAVGSNGAGLVVNSDDFGVGGETNIGYAGNTGNLTLTVGNSDLIDSLVFLGTTRILGAGDLLIQPLTDGSSIGIGNGTAGNLVIDEAEVTAIQDGFNSITIGRPTGQHAIQIGTATFADAVTLRTSGAGTLTVVAGRTLTGGGIVDMIGSAASITLISDTPILLAGDVVTHSNSINIDGQVLVSGAHTLTTALSGAGAAVLITGDIDGANIGGTDRLTLNAGVAGSVTLQGNVVGQPGMQTVTGGQDLNGLTVTGATITAGGIQLTNGSIVLTADAIILDGTEYRTHGLGDIGLFGPVMVTALVTDITSDTGLVIFDQMLDGGAAVTVSGVGVEFYAPIGSLSPLDSLAVSGEVTLFGDPDDLLSVFTMYATGDISFLDSLTLMANTTIISIAGNITLGEVDGSWSLALEADSTVFLNGTIGGTDNLMSFGVGASALVLAAGVDVITAANNGFILFNVDSLVLGGVNAIDAGMGAFQIFPRTATLSIELAPTNSGLHDVYYDSAFSNVTAGSFVIGDLSHQGDIHIGNATGGVIAAYHLQVITGGTASIVFDNDYTVSGGDFDLTLSAGGNVVFGDLGDAALMIDLANGSLSVLSAVLIVDNTEIFAGSAGFSSTIIGAFALATDATTTVFNGAVNVASLEVMGLATLNAGTVDTTGDQIFHGSVTLASDNVLTAGGDITFNDTVAGAFALATDATTTVFNDTVDVASLEVTGLAMLNGSSIDSSGNQTFSGAVTLTVDNTLTAGGDITFNDTVAGAFALATDATTTVFNGAVDVASLEVTGLATLNAGTVDTTGDQIFHGSVTLASDNVLTAGGDITFNDTVAGAFALATDATTTVFNDTVDVASLEVTGLAMLNGSSIDSSGNQTFNGAVTLTTDNVLTAGGDITFNDTIIGAFALETGITTTVFNGAVDVASLGVTGAATISGGTVVTTGNQEFGGPVTLTTDTVLTAGGDIVLGDTVSGAFALATDATMTIFNGPVDLTTLLVTGWTLLGAGTVTTSGEQIYDGDVTLATNNTLTAGGDIVMASLLGAGHGLSVDVGTGSFYVTGDATGLGALTLIAAGTVFDVWGLLVAESLVVTADVGNVGLFSGGTVTDAVTFLNTGTLSIANGFNFTGGVTATAPSQVTLSGTLATLGTPMTLGTLLLTGSASLDTGAGAGNVTVTGTTNGAQTLLVTVGTGNIDFQGAVGNTTALSSLTVGSATTARFGANVTSTGAQLFTAGTTQTNGVHTTSGTDITITGNLFLQSATTLNTGAGAGNVTVTGTTNGAQTLLVTAGTGTLMLGDAGLTTSLTSLTVNAAQINLVAVTTTSTQNYTGSTILNSSLVAATGSIVFNSPVTLMADLAIEALAASSNITFMMTLDGAFNLVVDAGPGDVNFNGQVGGSVPLASLTVTGGNSSINIRIGVVTTGVQEYFGRVVANGELMGSTILFNGVLQIDSGAYTTIISDTIDFNGGTGSVQGTGQLVLIPATQGASLSIGGVGAVLVLSGSALQGFNGIAVIGAVGLIGTSVDVNSFSIIAGDITINETVALGDTGILMIFGSGDIALEQGNLQAGELWLVAGSPDSFILNNNGLESVLIANSMFLVAGNQIGADAGQEVNVQALTLGDPKAPVQITQSAPQAYINNLLNSTILIGAGTNIGNFLADTLNLAFSENLQVTTLVSSFAARETAGETEVISEIDPSLFEDISLYAVEQGVTLPADQSEEEECQPDDPFCDAAIGAEPGQSQTEGQPIAILDAA